MEQIKIISWNVNGIRAILKKNFEEFVDTEKPDILCIQETKAHPDQVDEIMHDYDHHFWNSAEKRGYSGVAVFSKIKPLEVKYGIGHELDSEGRVLTLEFEDYFLVTVYTPNSKDDLSRVDLRHDSWDPAFLKHCKQLEKEKPVIFCGDLNVAHEPIDLKNDKANMTTETKPGNAGFTDKERSSFSKFLSEGFVDTFRYIYPEKEKYSWWSYRARARENNAGWRIDYFLASKSLIKKIKDAFILNEVMGSDHCPVGIVLKGKA